METVIYTEHFDIYLSNPVLVRMNSFLDHYNNVGSDTVMQMNITTECSLASITWTVEMLGWYNEPSSIDDINNSCNIDGHYRNFIYDYMLYIELGPQVLVRYNMTELPRSTPYIQPELPLR